MFSIVVVACPATSRAAGGISKKAGLETAAPLLYL
jgi:hypothetical protein